MSFFHNVICAIRNTDFSSEDGYLNSRVCSYCKFFGNFGTVLSDPQTRIVSLNRNYHYYSQPIGICGFKGYTLLKYRFDNFVDNFIEVFLLDTAEAASDITLNVSAGDTSYVTSNNVRHCFT